MDWLTLYKEYTHETESSEIFNLWVGISTIASALRKKTWLELGRLKVFPNLYIVLVAEPGVARKSQAISYASSIISDIPAIVTSADSITAQALIQDLEDATCYDTIPGSHVLRHSSLSVISKEFETFLGGSSGSNKMLVTLTDLYDAGEQPWKYRTKTAGIATIPSVYLNILGATTPHSLQSCLSEIAVGGGLTSRIIFVCSKVKSKKVAIPELTDRVKELKEILTRELLRISLLAGRFVFTEAALKLWKEWYEDYDDGKDKRKQPRVEFDGWYSRKPMMVQKLSIILSASEGNDLKIHTRHLGKALEYIEAVEEEMGMIFPVEKVKEESKDEEKEDTTDVEFMLKYIKHYKSISEKHLLQLVWRNIKEDEFDKYINIIMKRGKCTRSFTNPTTGTDEIWYHFKEVEDAV